MIFLLVFIFSHVPLNLCLITLIYSFERFTLFCFIIVFNMKSSELKVNYITENRREAIFRFTECNDQG